MGGTRKLGNLMPLDNGNAYCRPHRSPEGSRFPCNHSCGKIVLSETTHRGFKTRNIVLIGYEQKNNNPCLAQGPQSVSAL